MFADPRGYGPVWPMFALIILLLILIAWVS
jgi:hypothetical protein